MKKALLFLTFVFIAITNAFAQYTKLLEFSGSRYISFFGNAQGSLISDGTFLYGTSNYGGAKNVGTLFKVKPDGTEYSRVLEFASETTGAYPKGIVYDGTFLYGSTLAGATSVNGSIYRIKPDGTEYSTIFDYDYSTGSLAGGSLFSDGTYLYGVTTVGGANTFGTIFKIKSDGTDHTVLLDFDGVNGVNPVGSLVYDGTFLYGMTAINIFKIKPDGTDFSAVLNFNDSTGRGPSGSLIFDGTYLYGTTYSGANLFKIKPDGTGYTKLFNFDTSIVGRPPIGDITFNGTYFYGITNEYNLYREGGTLVRIKSDGTEYSRLLNFNNTGNGSMSYISSLISDSTFVYGITVGNTTKDYTTLFKILPDGTGYTEVRDFDSIADGSLPLGGLLSDSTFLYGTTICGGTHNMGTIFKTKLDGTGYLKLHDFRDSINGILPKGSLVSDGTFLYGTTGNGGVSNTGVIFKIKPDGTEYLRLFDFDAINGGFPSGGLIYDGTFLYGMTQWGGDYNFGTIYKIKPDGTAFSKLLDFDGTNGKVPYASSLVFDGTFLYGITNQGGTDNFGVLFKIKPDGTAFSKLLDFDGIENGKWPSAVSLSDDGMFLYGTTEGAGTSDLGLIYKIKTDGTGFNKMFDFDLISGTQHSAFISDGTFLYGTTENGGTSNVGTLFKIKPDGTGYSRIFDFNGRSTGSSPSGPLISDGSNLYGMIYTSSTGIGNIFRLGIPSLSTCIANYTTVYDSISDNFILVVDSATTAIATSYQWDFGDGSISSLTVPTHTYPVAGSYNVCMKVYTAEGDSCSYCHLFTGDEGFTINIADTVVIPSCIAGYSTAYDSTLNTFVLTVDSATMALATSYYWDFGDGSTSTLATPSHIYTVDSLYNVCMEVYYADGDSCTYCHTIGIDSAGNIIRDGGFSLVVRNATTGISENPTNKIAVTIYPNPNTGIFQLAIDHWQLKSTADLSIYNVVGEKIYAKNNKQLNPSTTIDLSDQSNGIYFMQLKTEQSTITKKIIINR